MVLTERRIVIIFLSGIFLWVLFIAFTQREVASLLHTFYTPDTNYVEASFVDHQDLPRYLADRSSKIGVELHNRSSVPGEYEVTLRVENDISNAELDSQNITINPNEERIIRLMYLLPNWVRTNQERTKIVVGINGESRLHFWLEPDVIEESVEDTTDDVSEIETLEN